MRLKPAVGDDIAPDGVGIGTVGDERQALLGSTLSGVGASGKPRAVHFGENDLLERNDYQGTVTPTRSGSSSFSQGMANGMAIRQSLEASAARSEIYRGCMCQLGWAEG